MVEPFLIKLKIMKKTTVLCAFLVIALMGLAQDDDSYSSAYQFTDIIDLPATSVKDQYRTGTCWAFSGLSFIESELIRTGKGEHDLSEMWIVKKDYHARAIDYVRWQGAKSFSGGAESNNVFDRIKEAGIVPEKAFVGLNYGDKNHVHAEMDYLLKAYIKAVVKNKNKKLSTAWVNGFDGILDAYLGADINEFAYNGKDYTPVSFRDEMNIVPDDYVEISSFTHHPFYTNFVMEVPDNWSLGTVNNVPMGEMLSVVYNALDNGYTVLWGSDVSEYGFSHKDGVAIIPETDIKNMNDSERAKWELLTDEELEDELYSMESVVPEKVITQEMRQQAFDNYETTDDHGMHITVKNSWNTDSEYEGYFYASEAWFLYKTLSVMVHKDAIPKGIKNKMGVN